MIKNFHFILQGKGGVGKTTVSTFIAQYLKYYLKKEYLAIDTDQVNASFSSFKALNVQSLNIMENNNINARGWDALLEKIIKTDKTNVIIDNGASSFVPFIAYAVENSMMDIITSDINNYEGNIYIHVVIAGGEGLVHTLGGLKTICEKFNQDNVKIIVWLNPFFGNIEQAGTQFEGMEAYKKYKNRIFAVMRIGEYTRDTFGKDISDMLTGNKTFAEMIESPSISIASRSRYAIVQKNIFNMINSIEAIFDDED